MSDFERKSGSELDEQERERKLAEESDDEVEGHVLMREDEPMDEDRARRRR